MPNLLNPLDIKLSLEIPTIDDSILTGKRDGSLSWISQTDLLYQPISNVIYVTKNGKDINTGKSLTFAKRTIKSALNAATNGTTIIVSSGVYKEQTPLICPPNITITAQDSLVQIESINNANDVFYLNDGVVIEGITIINTRSPSFAFSLNSNVVVKKAPVIKKCSVITGPFLNDQTLFIPNQTVQIEGITPTNLPIINNDLVPSVKRVNESGSGNGILVDGSAFALESIENSIIVDSCNIISQGGIGILVKNSASCYANNCLTKFCNMAYKTETGGKLILNSSTSSHGNYALSASGFNTVAITTGIVESITINAETNLIEQIKLNSLIKQPIAGNIIEIDNQKYQISSATKLENGISYVSIISNLTDITLEITVNIYEDSRITANNHNFEHAGSGVTYNALVENNGQADVLKQISKSNFGSIYYSSNDLAGIFKIGDIFEVNQLTGAITTTPSSESLINIGSIGPLIRNGVAVGVKMAEISDNNQLISSTGLTDPYTVPTQTAIVNYLDNGYFPLTGGTITGSTTIQNINFVDNVISSSESNQNIKISPNGTGSIDVDLSKIINLAEPVDDNDAATKKFVVDIVQGGITVPSVIPIIWGSDQANGFLTLRSTKSNTKPNAGVILDDQIPSTSTTTGTLVIDGGVGISGALNATTKSFNIEHPLDSNKRLCYGSLESPYHGIRLTGCDIVSNGICVVNLPTYICKLVKENSAHIQLTNIKHDKILWVESVDTKNNQFTIKTSEIIGDYQFYWSFTAIRDDVDDLVVEY